MNYIYDITLNFNKELYNFYEWENDDCIEFYLKIPVFKVEEKTIEDFITCDFIVDKQFLNRIFNKTELYGKSNVIHNKYSCIITSETKVLAILFNEKGESYKKSYMSIDEENEVLEYSKFIKYSLINYKIKSKKSRNSFITRNEYKMKNRLLSEIKSIYKNKQFDKLEFIFYEVYNERNNNENKIYAKLVNLIENNSEKMAKIKNLFNSMKSKEKII